MTNEVILINRKYRHFKGNGYKVLHLAQHSETMESYVVYQALYGEFGIWVRPASMFLETVVREGVSYQRFSLLEEEGEI